MTQLPPSWPGPAPAGGAQPQQAPNWLPRSPGDTPWGTATAPPPGPGWAPPPRPGLLPLRPLTLGEVIGISFRAMRRNPLPTLGFALLATAIGTIASVLPLVLIGISGGFSDGAGIPVEGAVTIAISFVLLGAVQLVVTSLLQGIVAVDVSRGALGERLRIRGIFAVLRGRVLRILGWSVALEAAAGIAVGILAGLAALLGVAIGGTPGLVVAIVLGALALAALAVAGVWIGVKCSFTPSAIVVERLGIRAGVARSWRLTRGRFWPVLGTNLLVNAIYSTVGQVISSAFVFVIEILAGLLLGPSANDPGAIVVLVIVVYAVFLTLSLTVSAIGQVAAAVTATTLYLDARMRGEGFDLELRRYTEARVAGRTDAPDPFPAERAQA